MRNKENKRKKMSRKKMQENKEIKKKTWARKRKEEIKRK